MEEVIYLEVLDRFDRVKERVRLSSFPVEVGRAYSNHVILDDRYVSPCHLRIVRGSDGQIVAEDLSSRNGLFLMPEGTRVRTTPLGLNTQLRIGRTLLRLRTRDCPVDEAEREGIGLDLQERFVNSGRVQAATLTAVIALIGTHQYLGVYNENQFWNVLLDGMPQMLMATLVYLSFWCFLGIIFVRRLRFRAHLTIFCTLFLLSHLSSWLEALLSFNCVSDLWLKGVDIVSILFVFSLGLFAHLWTSTQARPAHLWLLAILIAGGMSAKEGLEAIQSRWDFSQTLRFSDALLPPVCRVAPGVSVQDFFRDARTLKDRVDQDRASASR